MVTRKNVNEVQSYNYVHALFKFVLEVDQKFIPENSKIKDFFILKIRLQRNQRFIHS